MPTPEQIFAANQNGDLSARVEYLEQTLATLLGNGLNSLLIRPGTMRFGGNDMQLDQYGIQVNTQSGSNAIPALFFTDKFYPVPDNEPNQARIGGFALSGSGEISMAANKGADPLAKVVAAYSSSGGSAYFNVIRDGGTVLTTAGLELLDSATWGTFQIIKGALYFDQMTGDPDVLADGKLWYNHTDDKLYARINGATVELGGGGGMSLLVKEADETVNNSAVLQNDDEILFAVGANEVYQFEGVLIVSTGTTPNLQMTFTGPAGAVGSFGAVVNIGTALVEGAGDLAGAIGLAGAWGGTRHTVRFWGGIHNGGTGGNCTLQWAQASANLSDTIVHAGSYIKWQLES